MLIIPYGWAPGCMGSSSFVGALASPVGPGGLLEGAVSLLPTS